jgi:hypothetical protein
VRNVHHLGAITAAYIAFLLLAGCAQLGFEAPQSFEEKLAYTISQNAAARQAASNALEAGTIELADAQFVLKSTDSARELLDAAKVASGAGDIKTAEGRLALATTVLGELQAYLQKRSKK